MQRCITQKKVGLIKACITDLNQSVSQVAAYTTYGEGCHCGKGPTIFELVYHNADTIGSPKAFINTSNLAISHTMMYDLFQTDPLHDDPWTTFVKCKTNASGQVLAKEFHWSNKIWITIALTRGLKRRNLDSLEFSPIPVSPLSCTRPATKE